jgi:hypothetical protein
LIINKCGEIIQHFAHTRALEDAEKAIALEPQWPKGYFRKGRALFGLKVSSPLSHEIPPEISYRVPTLDV